MNRKRIIALLMATAMSVLLTACGEEPERAPSGNVESSVSAIEDAMITKNDSIDREDREDFRDGTSEDTVATPDDFPDEYDFGSGKIQDYSRDDMLRKMPMPEGNATVLNTEADPSGIYTKHDRIL